MKSWDVFKKYFNAWEGQTAILMEAWLKSPLVLEPAGHALSAAMKTKAAGEKATASFWGSVGLPTKRDQERTLHALNQIQSRLLDLEEKLAVAEAARASSTGPSATGQISKGE